MVLLDADLTTDMPNPKSKKSSNVVIVDPEDHEETCEFHVNLLAKHAQSCENKNKFNDVEKEGSFDVVGKMVYPGCVGQKNRFVSTIKPSSKGFFLNDPKCFGKPLKESRSKIENVPLLPVTNSKTSPCCDKKGCCELGSVEGEPMQCQQDGIKDVVSVYIHKDKNQEVPDGFEKVHYNDDNCTLHDPFQVRQMAIIQEFLNKTKDQD